MLRKRFSLLFILILVGAIQCQLLSQILSKNSTVDFDTLRIASYNILNYPGTDASIRNPYFRRVVHTMRPDVLVVQEMQSQSGVDNFRDNVLNYYQPGLYSTVPFNNGFDSDNSIFFKTGKISFLGASYITTALRDIAEYVVRIVETSDTLRLYSLHLKASNTSSDEQKRLAEATILRNHLNTLPPGTQFLILGDFNSYSSSDAGLQKLLGNESNNNGRAKDPLSSVGNWNNNASFSAIHTQSPRVRSFGGGTTGGMDDRFDLILTSYTSLDDNILVSRYTAYGNDGNHFNDSINHLPNTAVADSVSSALHYAADHLPVYCDFMFAKESQSPPVIFSLLSPADSATVQPITGTLSWQASLSATAYDVYLDQNNPPSTIVSVNQSGTSYNYTPLEYSTKYYWKVIAKNGGGNTISNNSPWKFTTLGASPGVFLLVAPSNEALKQPLSGTLVWNSSPSSVSYDIYLSTNNPPTTIVAFDYPDTTYNYNSLSMGQLYYWKVVSKNENGSTDASNGPRQFTTANVPTAPSNFASISVTTQSLEFQWMDNAIDETGYRVHRSQLPEGPFVQSGYDLPANTVFFVDTGLQANQQYYYHIEPFNDLGEGNFGSITLTTLAAVPGPPTIVNAIYSSATIVLDPVANSSSTQYVIQTTHDSVMMFVQSNGTLDTIPVWQTYTKWGATSGLALIGLHPCSEYTFSVRARNTEGVETVGSLETTEQLPCFSISHTVVSGWNLVSIPLVTMMHLPASMFPTSASDGFTYRDRYLRSDSLTTGIGYWIKISIDDVINLSGEPYLYDTIDVAKGWNMIGSLSFPVSVNLITSVPPALITSEFIEYSEGYFKADSIKPFKGYWVKASQSGQLILSASHISPLSARIRISPINELPPPPPDHELSDLEPLIPNQFLVHQNYPNPFNPTTIIRYDLPMESRVALKIYNTLGQEVKTVVDEMQDAGFKVVEWQANNLPSGIYIYRLSAEANGKSFVDVKKLLLVK